MKHEVTVDLRSVDVPLAHGFRKRPRGVGAERTEYINNDSANTSYLVHNRHTHRKTILRFHAVTMRDGTQ